MIKYAGQSSKIVGGGLISDVIDIAHKGSSFILQETAGETFFVLMNNFIHEYNPEHFTVPFAEPQPIRYINALHEHVTFFGKPISERNCCNAEKKIPEFDTHIAIPTDHYDYYRDVNGNLKLTEDNVQHLGGVPHTVAEGAPITFSWEEKPPQTAYVITNLHTGNERIVISPPAEKGFYSHQYLQLDDELLVAQMNYDNGPVNVELYQIRYDEDRNVFIRNEEPLYTHGPYTRIASGKGFIILTSVIGKYYSGNLSLHVIHH